MWWNFRARLKDKDERIEDLVQSRNRFQDIVLRDHEIERKTSKKPKKSRKN